MGRRSDMELFKCKKEALREDGSKIMNFTKGKEYIGISDGEGGFYINDDKRRTEHFFDYKVLFKKL